MYPLIRVVLTVFTARFRSRLDVRDEGLLNMRVGITDIDVFGELNNARHLTVMEIGRWDMSQRLGLMPIIRKNKWGFVIGGVSIRYRRRIPFLAKYTLSTRILCHDSRWFYFLQETHRHDKICSSALIKAGIVSKEGLVDATEVIGVMNKSDWDSDVPDWVQAWIDAEGMRPWPGNG